VSQAQQLRACTPPGHQLEALLEGNRRFAAAWQAARKLNDATQRMQALAGIWQNNCQADPLALSQGQKPWVALLSCADSRLAVEWMFANRSGEMFQVSAAGNTAFDDATASLEYAVSVLGVALVPVDDLTKAIQGNARYSAAQLSIRSAYFDISSGRVSVL